MTRSRTPVHAVHGAVLVVGESLVDVVRRNGDEIARPGGSPMNVAVGLQRLEVPATLHSAFGADRNGVEIAQHLEASGVRVTPTTVSDRTTSIARATIDRDGAASYEFAITWNPAKLDVDDGAFDAVHTGSIAAVLQPGATSVGQWLSALRASSTVSYDPNVRPQLMGSPAEARERVEHLIGLADVVKASDEDVAWLYPDAAVGDIMQRWLGLGPAVVVVTRGGDGADALAASGAVHVPAHPAKVVDTIGAGDSFMAGLLAALSDQQLLGGRRRDALRAVPAPVLRDVVVFAARCAAITVSRQGADPPDRDDLAEGQQ